MLGRSSRGRGLCKGIYFPLTKLTAQQVMVKMNREANTHLCDLERAIRLIWKRRTNFKLASVLEEDQKDGMNVRSLEDIKALLGRGEYEKLTKGFEF